MSFFLRSPLKKALFLVPRLRNSFYRSQFCFSSSPAESRFRRQNSPQFSSERRVDFQKTPSDEHVNTKEWSRFQLTPAAKDREKFLKLLQCLKRRERIPEWARSGGGLGGGSAIYKSILYTAPYLAELFGCEQEFTDVVDEWFDHVKPFVLNDVRRGELAVTVQFNPQSDKASTWKRSSDVLFNIAYQLQYLGRLNRTTDGRLVETLGWDNVNFLARRMVECGFFTFTYREVVGSALTGLRDLYETVLKRQTSPRPDYVGVKWWLLGLVHFLSNAEARPSEWRQLVGESNASITDILTRVVTLENAVLNRGDEKTEFSALFRFLKRILCNYSKIYFDYTVDDCQLAVDKGRMSPNLKTVLAVEFLNDYATVWSRYRPELGDGKTTRYNDPDFYVVKSWRSWYDACNVIFHHLILAHNHYQDFYDSSGSNDRLESITIDENFACLRSPKTMKLLFKALDVAYFFDETSSFYAILFENWNKVLERCVKHLGFESQAKEISFFVSALMRVAVLDRKKAALPPEPKDDDEEMELAPDDWIKQKPNDDDDDDEVENVEAAVDNAIKREMTVELATSLWNDLIQLKRPSDVPYRAMVEIVTSFVDWSNLEKADGKQPAMFSHKFLVYLRNWCVDKREKNLSFRAAESSSTIKAAIEKLDLPPSRLLDDLFLELDRLHAIGSS